MKRNVTLMVGILLAIIIVAGAYLSTSQNATQQMETTQLVIGTSVPMDHPSPPYSSGQANDVIMHQICDTLVQYKAGTSQLIPMLAVDTGTPSGNGKMWTFKLREGVKFHDGTPFNATAIKYYFEVVAPTVKAGSTYIFLDGLDHVEVADPYTVVFYLKSPTAAWPDILASYTAAIPGYSALKRLGVDEFDRRPVGTGPFKLSSMIPRQEVILEVNQDYWGLKDATNWGFKDASLDRIHLKTLIFRQFGDSSTLKLAIEKGEIDVALPTIDPGDFNSLKSNPNLVTYDVSVQSYLRVLVLNMKFPPLDRKEVRQALAYAIDYDRIVQVAYKGNAHRAYDFMPPGYLGYKEAWKKYSYDPQKSLSMLKQAGITTPVKLTIWYQQTGYGPQEPDMAVVVADSAKAGGFDIKIEGRERATFRDYYKAKNVTQMFMIGWTATYLNSDDFARAFMSSNGFSGSAANYLQGDLAGMYPQADNLVASAVAELDPSKRTGLYGQLADLYAEWVPSIPLVQPSQYMFTRNNVKGVQFNIAYHDIDFFTAQVTSTNTEKPPSQPGIDRTTLGALVGVSIIILAGLFYFVRRHKTTTNK